MRITGTTRTDRRTSATRMCAALIGISLLTACSSSSDSTTPVAEPSVTATPSGFSSAGLVVPSDFLLMAGCNAINQFTYGAFEGTPTSASSVETTSGAVNALQLPDATAPGLAPGATGVLTLPPTPRVVVTQLDGTFSDGISDVEGGVVVGGQEDFTSYLSFTTPNGLPLLRPEGPENVTYDLPDVSVPRLAALGQVVKATPAKCARKYPVPANGGPVD